jgi:arylsulfatase A-like enzyme
MFFLAATGLAFAGAAACHGAEPETAKPRPNILVIVTDQQFAEVMSCRMGNEFIKTPALDELTSRGAFFTSAYCAFPLCGPSRNSMFSGLYPHRVRWKPVHDHPSHYLGRYLLDAGYETAYSGKSELHAKDVAEHGFETILAPMGVPTRKTALANGGWDAWAASEAIGFIARPHEKPFLLVASFLNPHNVCEWSRRLAGQEGTLDCGEIGEPPPPEQLPPAPANIGPQADEPDGMTLMRRGFQANRLFPVGGYTVDDWRRHRWGYYRMVELVDREIGRVLKALREAGLEDETLVIFTSDHGECAGAHGWNQKSVPYDESTRVPFIVKWNGRTPAGISSEKLINTGIDLVPTVLDAAGVAIPKELPGRSALPLALGRPVADWPDAVVSQMSMSQAGEIDGFKPTMKWWMVRTDRYKYCLFSRGQQRESFIDMQADPGEMRNLAADPAHRQALLEHRERLARYGREHDDRHVAPLLADDVKPIPFDMGKQPAATGAAGRPHYYWPIPVGSPRVIKADVAVYGGTPGGVAAAVQAARMGCDVVLVSFNRHVGGMTSGGLTATDIGVKDSIGGIAREVYARIGKPSGFRPSEAEAVFLTLLQEAGVRVLFEQRLTSVRMEGTAIRSITMESGETYEAAVFLDSTYEGDLMAAANVSYRVGREPVTAYDESAAGAWYMGSWLNVYQFCRLPIDPFRDPGNPESGVLPEISSELPGKPGEGDAKVQAYNFRMFLSNAPDRLPYPKPPGYQADRYALLARFLNADPRIEWRFGYTVVPMTDGPVQLRRGDCNNAGSFSTDCVGRNYRWPDGTSEAGSSADPVRVRRGLSLPLRDLYQLREEIFQDHLTYQQGLMWFLANEAVVPEVIRQKMNLFGLDPQEFGSTGGWPHQLYVREARRMVSDRVMTQHHCESTKVVQDSVGLASYPMDSHFCQRVIMVEDGKANVRNEGGWMKPCRHPWPISYHAIVPKQEECTNLLVPVCLSATHVAFGSIRMEPVFMILGQSAGAAAALTLHERCDVQDLPYERLRQRLLADGQRLAWTK